MAEQKNPQAQPELSLSEQTRIRREKLTNLQAEGQNPFVITALTGMQPPSRSRTTSTRWRASPSRWQAAS